MIGETQIATTTQLAPAGSQVTPAPVAAPAPTHHDPRDQQAQSVTPPVSAISATSAANEPPSFPVSLQFDQDTHRFIIEARDRVSGFVVFQIPFKAAVNSVAGTSSGTARGNRIDRAV